MKYKEKLCNAAIGSNYNCNKCHCNAVEFWTYKGKKCHGTVFLDSEGWNNESKILWDFEVQTIHVIKERRPDLVIVDKGKRICQIVHFAIPYYAKIMEKLIDKITKYQDLAE